MCCNSNFDFVFLPYVLIHYIYIPVYTSIIRIIQYICSILVPKLILHFPSGTIQCKSKENILWLYNLYSYIYTLYIQCLVLFVQIYNTLQFSIIEENSVKNKNSLCLRILDHSGEWLYKFPLVFCTYRRVIIKMIDVCYAAYGMDGVVYMLCLYCMYV